VVYVGSTTGRDGMGGASFASAELSEASIDDRPAVQVGDPFLEKGLIEACLEAFKSGVVVAAQDMGAAGLTCSCAEMAAKGNLGIELNLDLVPARETGMTAYDFLLSESQERMLFVVQAGKEEELMELFRRWGLQAAVVGKVLQEEVVRVLQHGEVAAEVPSRALAEDTPINKRDLISEPPADIQAHWQWQESSLSALAADQVGPVLLQLLDDPTIASKKWVWRQYDHQVQANTVVPPGGADAAVLRLRYQEGAKASGRGVAATLDCPNRWVALDPERGGMAAVAEAARNLSCVGAEPIAVTDNLNFPSPETPTGYWQLAMACRGIAEACRILDTPVTGGNVSLYNNTRLPDGTVQPIQPTPVVGMVGLVERLDRLVGLAWPKPQLADDGDHLLLLGLALNSEATDDRIGLGGSSYLQVVHGLCTGRPPRPDLGLEMQLQEMLRAAIAAGLVSAAHDLSDGGFLVAVAEMAMAAGCGAQLKLASSELPLQRLLFGEGGARVLVTVPAAELAAFIALSQARGFPYQQIGFVQANELLQLHIGQEEIFELELNYLSKAYQEALPRRLLGHTG
jgi:phosphoribosylformylglycinamidine synthase